MHDRKSFAWTGAALALALAITLTGPACGSSIGGDGNQPGADGGTGDGGPPLDSTCSTRGGSRLREVLHEAVDGSLEHQHFQDTELDTPCAFATASDGAIRCLPRPGGTFRRAEAIYTDGDCQDLVAQIDKAQPDGDRMEVVRTSECHAQTSAYHLIGGAAGVTHGEETFVLLPGSGCVPSLAADTAAFEYRLLGAAIPLDRFVEASETMVGDGRLRVPRLDGADGSSECRASRPLRDQDRGGAACDAAIAEDGVRRCLPLGEGPIADVYFTDTDCGGAAVDVGVLDPTCQPANTMIRELVDAACGSVQRVRAMGAPLGQLYWTGPGECGPTPGGTEFFRIGAAAAPDGFAALSASETPAGDRLLRLDLTAEGVRFPSGLWRDPHMGADCRFDAAPDGATRCLPTPTLETPQAVVSTLSNLTYSDEDCTMPIVVATLSQTSACGGAAPTYAVHLLGPIETVPHGTVFQLGELITSPIYRKAGTCALYTAEVELYAVGPVVPSASFVSAIEVTE